MQLYMDEAIVEPFRVSAKKSRRNAYSQINAGIAEFLVQQQTPSSKEGFYPELIESFEETISEKPLKIEDIEKSVEDFFYRHFDELRGIFRPYDFPQIKTNELIDKFGITNEDIGLLGVNYFIREKDGVKKIYKTDEDYPEGRETYGEIYPGDILALVYAKEEIKVHSVRDAGRSGGKIAQRFYLQSADRYLCANDFGMRVWDEEEDRMVGGEVSNAGPFIQTIKKEIERIGKNVENLIYPYYVQLKNEIVHLARKDSSYGFLDNRKIDEINNIAWEKAAEHLDLQERPKNKKIILGAVSAQKVEKYLHFNYGRIAKIYGLVSDDPINDYEQFDKRNSDRIEKLFREPNEDEKEGVSIDFVYSDLFKKPVIVTKNFNTSKLINEVKYGVREVLAHKAAQSDPNIKYVYDHYRYLRGKQSPFYYSDDDIYDFLRAVGPEKASEVLESDRRNVSEQLISAKFLKEMGYDISKFDADRLKKQLNIVSELRRSGIWDYLAEREKEVVDKVRMKLGDKSSGKDWLALLGKEKSRDLLREGKRMYWLAKKVYMKNPWTEDGYRYYRHKESINWEVYDLSKANVSQEKLNEHLEKNIHLIVALLSQRFNMPRGREEDVKRSPATLGLLVQALEQGRDLRGVAIATDKQRYLEGIVNGHEGDDLEFALKDWPKKWLDSVSEDELTLYYDYANDYIQVDSEGLANYAAWRSGPEGKEWNDLFAGELRSKNDLDFRICIGGQTKEIRRWYKDGAEYVGNNTIQNYLLRFNSTRNSEGRLANLHDVLFWIPNIKKLEKEDVVPILNEIKTMDDNRDFVNLLPRYDKEKDPFRGQGKIQSLRELKKRVLAIESNIDLSNFPPELLDITSAPGFNLGALESIRNRNNFDDLIKGKIDKEQSFKPHKRLFAGRSLTEALSEGLGSKKKNIKGTADSPAKLFNDISQLIKGITINGKILKITDLLDDVPVEIEKEIIGLLQNHKVDIGPIVEAQIHSKSDPEGWVCGNYTDCCMPFGDPKNDDYMFNKLTQYFTVKYNGRIIAQSVVVDGMDGDTGSDVIILDNIEVANNYKNLVPLLSKVYQTFWTEYTSKPVKVGTGYSDLIPTGSVLERNHYQPKTSLSYSDAGGSQIYDLPKMKCIESMNEIITFANITERDVDLITQMESEAYPSEMVQGREYVRDILEKQRELEVPGAVSSFFVRQGKYPAGYTLVLPEKSEVNADEIAAHIYDMYVLPKFRGMKVARKMMDRLIEGAAAYEVPLEMEARASTSYPLLTNGRVRDMLERKGFYLTINEKLPQYLGGEDFYFLRFDYRKPND